MTRCLLPLFGITLAVIATAGEPKQPEPASDVLAKPLLKRPDPPSSLKRENLGAKYKDAWDRYEDRVESASALLVMSLEKVQSGDGRYRHSWYRGEEEKTTATFLATFTQIGEFPDEFLAEPGTWEWQNLPPYLAPVHAVALLTRREFADALQRLEADYALLSDECRKTRNFKAADELREQISLLLEADWTHQREIASRREQQQQEEWERQQKKYEARRVEQKELRKKVPEPQFEILRRHGVNAKELVDGKPFLTKNAAGRILLAYLKGTRWTNAFGEVYEWDDSGLLWLVNRDNRKFLYAEYAKSDECTIKSPHVAATKLFVDKKNNTITPETAAGRKATSFLRELENNK